MDDWYDEEWKRLKAAEEAAAAEQPEMAEDSLGGLKGLEEAARGFYSGGGKKAGGKGAGKGLGKGGKGKAAKGMLKKGGPMAAIAGIITAVGGLMMGAQTLMPVAISEMIIEKFNSIGISSSMASDAWLNTQLNYGVRMENLETGQTANLFAFSEYQVQQFETQGIKVVNDVTSGGMSFTALLYEKNGTFIPVVGSDFLGTDLTSAIRAASGLNNIGAAVSAETALADPDFKKPYTTASKSWRGGSSGWFDEMMSNITETKLSIERNRWARYASKSLGQMTDEFKEIAASAERKKTSDYEVDATKRFDDEPPYVEGQSLVIADNANDNNGTWTFDGWSANNNPNGEQLAIEKIIPVPVEIDEETGEVIDWDYDVIANNTSSDYGTSITGADSVSSLETRLTNKATRAAAVADGASTATAVVDTTCAVVEGLMSIYTVVSAYQSLQFLNLISGYLESVDKMKAGYGDASPIHEYSTNLTTVAPTVETNGSGENTTQTVVAEKTAMESAGMSWLFSDVPINSNDTSVQNTNFESIMTSLSSITGNIQITAHVFETCGYARVASGFANLILTGMSFIPIAGGAITLTQKAFQIGVGVLVDGAIQLFFQAAIPVIVRKVVNSIIEDAATEWFGEDLGNAMISGASKYLGGNGSSGGQGPGSESKVIAYLNEQATVIAEEAEYQRSIRSPFDISSPHTFLGSLAYSVLPLAYSSSGAMSALTKVSSLASSSLVAMLPTATAVGVNNEITSTGDCPLLEGVGAVGDAYCNAYIITDTATIGSDPVAIEEKVHQMDGGKNFNSDGTIKEDSNLAKYITYCGQRTSQYGLKDSGIVEGLGEEAGVGGEGGGGFVDFLKNLFSFIPVLGDTQNILDSVNKAGLLQWATGEACVVSESNDYWTDENQYYQRYAENQRLLENINPDYKSTVTAYLEDYYEENPVDDSFEGQLARFSGMSKAEVTDTLALIDYYRFLNEYDASTRYAFVTEPEVEEIKLDFNNENTIAANVFVLPREMIFADVRNRQMIVV